METDKKRAIAEFKRITNGSSRSLRSWSRALFITFIEVERSMRIPSSPRRSASSSRSSLAGPSSPPLSSAAKAGSTSK
jgi:hypothetical protein